MHRTFVGLFAIIFVVGIQGASRRTPASIDEDTIELTQLTEKVWSLKPAILKNAKPLVYCQVMDECCGEEDHSKAISLIDPNNVFDLVEFENIMGQCMNTTNSNNGNQLCTAVIKSIVPPWIVYRDSNIDKYMNIMDKYMNGLNKLDEWITACNAKENHAILCLSNTKLIESCTGKMLQKIFDIDYKNYEKAIKNIKQLLTDATQELQTVLVEDINAD